MNKRTNLSIWKSFSSLITLILIFFTLPTFAQLPTIEWQKTLVGTETDESFKILQTADNGFIIVGLTYSNDGDVANNAFYITGVELAVDGGMIQV